MLRLDGFAASFSAFTYTAFTHPVFVRKAMGPKGVAPNSEVVQPAAATDSAAQPASPPAAETASVAQLDSQPAAAAGGTAKSATLPLRELSKRSGQFGAWSVVVQQAKVEHYEYQYQGQKKMARCSHASSFRRTTRLSTAWASCGGARTTTASSSQLRKSSVTV